MTLALHGRKKAVFTIETGLRPNRDQLVFCPKNVAREVTAAPETDKHQETSYAQISSLSF